MPSSCITWGIPYFFTWVTGAKNRLRKRLCASHSNFISMQKIPKTLILGIGNLLLKDEGVGIHVIRALEKETLPPGVSLLDGGTGGLHLISWLTGYDRIILVDATLDEHAPGTIRVIRPQFATDYPPLMSAHEIGLRDMIEAMMLTGDLPEVQLIVVSAAALHEVDMTLSPAVEAAIPGVIRVIRDLLAD